MTTESNEALIRQYYEQVWNAGDLSELDAMLAPTYINHDPQSPGGTPGPSGHKLVVRAFRQAFPDARFTIEDLRGVGDEVVTRWTFRGTQRGPAFGVAPSGRTVVVTGISIDRLSDGRLIESWDNLDTLGLLQQIGATTLPGS